MRDRHQQFMTVLVITLVSVVPAYADAPDTYPEDANSSWNTTFAAMKVQVDTLVSQQVTPLALAGSLISELDEDWGEPGINYDYQMALLSVLLFLPYDDNASDPVEVAEAVRTGLLAFYESMPETAQNEEDLDGSAILYYAIGGALQSASLVACPTGDRTVSDVLVEIATNHSSNHPLHGNNNTLLASFLTKPEDVKTFERYYAAIVVNYGGEYEVVTEPGDPIIIPINIPGYVGCVDSCWTSCSQQEHWWQRLGCGLLCLLQCVPDLLPD